MEKKCTMKRTFHVSPGGVVWGIVMFIALIFFLIGCILEWICLGIITINNAIDWFCTYVSNKMDEHCN